MLLTAAPTILTQARTSNAPTSPQTLQHTNQDLQEPQEILKHHPTLLDHTQSLPPQTPGIHPSLTTSERKPAKKHLSDSSSLEANNTSASIINTTTPNTDNDTSKKTQKKAKTQIRSNSSSNLEDKILEWLKPAEEIFSNSSSVSILQFKYILENYTNKNINIHNLCKEIDSNTTSLMKLIDEIRPSITKSYLKIHLTKLANLLFQASPSQDP